MYSTPVSWAVLQRVIHIQTYGHTVETVSSLGWCIGRNSIRMPITCGTTPCKELHARAKTCLDLRGVGSDECCRSVFDWQKLGWILRCGARRVKHEVLQRLAAHSTMLCVSPGQCTIHLILRRCRRLLVRRELKINKRLRSVRISWAELHQFHA